jgi:hypothetical protein
LALSDFKSWGSFGILGYNEIKRRFIINVLGVWMIFENPQAHPQKKNPSKNSSENHSENKEKE